MSDRHEKWVPVEPGHVIPAGQPYRVEYTEGEAFETTNHPERTVPTPSANGAVWFVDSSWKPPLDLPTEPTWGIVIYRTGHDKRTYKWAGKFTRLDSDDSMLRERGSTGLVKTDLILDFIPLTDEQVARIEAAR